MNFILLKIKMKTFFDEKWWEKNWIQWKNCEIEEFFTVISRDLRFEKNDKKH